MKKIKYIYLFLVVSIVSCGDYLDIEPVGKVIPKSVKEHRSLLTSAYAISKNHKVLTTYRTDELFLNPNSRGIEQYEDIFIWNDENPNPLTRHFSYLNFYTTIFYANHIINNADNIKGNENEKNQLVGEAHALRAMQYFELINLYAKPYNKETASSDLGVPIVTEYDSEQKYPIQKTQKVYDLISADIEQAEKLINIDKQETGYNYRFSKIAVKSLKSRVLLFQNEWQKSIDAAKEALAIKSTLTDLNTNTSLMPSEYNSVESILALDRVSSFDLATYSNISAPLINAYNQSDDLRFQLYFTKNSDGSYSSKKNANVKFKCSYRTAELYLNIAEALTQLNKIGEAKAKLIEFTKTRYNSKGWNAYKEKINTLQKEDLWKEILEERNREFAIEGHRWNDLRRTTQKKITKTYNGKTYILKQNDSRYVIPFPKEATINNPNL